MFTVHHKKKGVTKKGRGGPEKQVIIVFVWPKIKHVFKNCLDLSQRGNIRVKMS